MKIGFYPKLAADGIRKNKRMYVPFILTCTGMVMMYYIILFLAVSDTLSSVTGVETLRSIFSLGSWVIAIFAAIFLFYTNSFLLRRRKKEFGLYNILGMGKANIARILVWETLIVAAISMALGLGGGIALSKLAELGLVYVMKSEVSYRFSVPMEAILQSLQVFGVIFALLLLNSIRQVRFASAISLMRSENAGEKPPKGNWVIGGLGVLILAGAYYLAVTIQNPVAALVTFFVAVVMVIVGTYLIMIAGSVLFCRILQRRKRYYYKPNHFVSVSSMVYRMKRNGAGLASICILATMVLVMMASTACLYFGEERAIISRYPRDINMSFNLENLSSMSDESTETLKAGIAAELESRNVLPENGYYYRSADLSGGLKGSTIETDVRNVSATEALSIARMISFVPLSDYNRLMGTSETLADGEALLYTNRGDYQQDTLSFVNGKTFHIKKEVDKFVPNGLTAMDVMTSMTLIVPDLEDAVAELMPLADYNGNRMVQLHWTCNLDTGTEPEQQIALFHELRDVLTDPVVKARLGYATCALSSQEFERGDFYSLFGALFYIGIILSLVFALAAVLIIYYKQISEGYEDQARFEIMQKVGMTKREIRKSINSQLLTVFFLPLAFAALHLMFAFPIIRKILLMFNLNNLPLFAATTAISIAAFGVFYAIIYRLTSNAYYHIVSGAREDS